MRRIVIGLVSLLSVTTLVWSQANPRGTASSADGAVTIEYGRPSAKGRDVLGMAQPDSYWRMGADAATKLKTNKPLMVGGERVGAGEYTLMAHVLSPDEIHLVVARSVSSGRPDEVAGKVVGEVEKGRDHVEQMTIDIEGAGSKAAIVLSWGSYRITMPFELAS